MDLQGEVFSTVGQVDAYAEFRLLAAPMLQTLEAPALMKWQEGPSGLQLQRLVKLASSVDPLLSEGAAVLAYQAQFAGSDPRAYSQTLVTVVGAVLSAAGGGLTFPFRFPFKFASSGGGTVAFTNAGNRPTPPIFRIYGMAVNPQIVDLASQKRISLLGTIGAGDYLELDVLGRTVKLNGSISRQNFYDAANSQWFELSPGVTILQLVAGSFDGTARLDVLGRSAYA